MGRKEFEGVLPHHLRSLCVDPIDGSNRIQCVGDTLGVEGDEERGVIDYQELLVSVPGT